MSKIIQWNIKKHILILIFIFIFIIKCQNIMKAEWPGSERSLGIILVSLFDHYN